VTLADAPHGRGRYNRGCRCATCKLANREYQRRHRSKRLRAVTTPPADVTTEPTGAVAAAVQAQLDGTAAALERPGLYAVAIRLAQLLDRDDAVPQFSAAAHRLSEILSTLSKHSTRRTRLSAVRSMTRDD